jgi:hypothetical protein
VVRASVIATVIVGTWNYSVSKRTLTNNIVLTYFDTINARKLNYPPKAEETDDWRRFIARLEYVADLANKGMIDGDMVPNSIKCEVLTAQMASFGEPILRIATPARQFEPSTIANTKTAKRAYHPSLSGSLLVIIA